MTTQVKINQKPASTAIEKSINIWWRLLRPHTLTASFVPVAIGTVLSLPYEQFRIYPFAAMLLLSLLTQAATNMLNEYFDFKRGLDHENSIGIGGTIVRDGIAPKTVLMIAQLSLGAAFLLGLYLCIQSSWWLLPVGLFCASVAYFYSGGPYPLSATPLGELASGICMGGIIIGTSFFIQTGTLTLECILMSIPTSILIGAILMANNIRDLDGDKEHGRKTLAILLGRKSATMLLAAMFILSYAWIVFLVIIKTTSPWALLSFASIFKAFQAVKGFQAYSTPVMLMPAMIATAQTNTLYGLLLSLGILIQYLVS